MCVVVVCCLVGVDYCHLSCYHDNIVTMVMGIAYRMYVCTYICTTLPGDVLVMVRYATAEVSPNASPRLVYIFYIAVVQYSYYCLLVSGGLSLLSELTTELRTDVEHPLKVTSADRECTLEQNV